MKLDLRREVRLTKTPQYLILNDKSQRYKETPTLGRVKVGERRKLIYQDYCGGCESLHWVIVTKIQIFFKGNKKYYRIDWKKERNS
jgi:hypothetical protein